MVTSGLRNAAGGFKAKRSTWTNPLKIINSFSMGIEHVCEIFIKILSGEAVCSLKICASLTKIIYKDNTFEKIFYSQVNLLEINFWIASNGNELNSLSAWTHNEIGFGTFHP